MNDLYLEKKAILPPSYVEHIEAYNGWEGDPGDGIGYIVVWDKETIQDRWESYEMAEHLGEDWFPFGSNGGDEMMCFDLRAGGDTVFWLPYIGMADETPLLRFDSFTQLARKIKEIEKTIHL